MSRRGGKGMSGQQPRAGFYVAPRWGGRAIGKPAGTPPRKRPLAGRQRAEKSISPGSCELPGDGKSEEITRTV